MKKKILFGITSLTLGGAERVLVDLCNKLACDYMITILTIYGGGELEKQLDRRVRVISLYDKPYNQYSKLQHLKISLTLLLRTKIPDEYETRVAFLEGPITRLFSKKCKAKKIAWIHNDVSKVFGTGIKAKIKKIFDKHIYSKYDELVFVSKENKQDFDTLYGKMQNERIIRNYINYNQVIEKSREEIDLPYNHKDINLVSVCRLVDQKAIDRFINVHAKLEKHGIHSKVYIIGDGPLRYTLQKQIDRTGETENFYLLGAKENPYPYIKGADYFCLLSYFEGYGMVLEEAKILDKNIVITDTAARECIKGYQKAIILKNTEKEIYEGLKKLLSSDNIKGASAETINTEEYNKIIDDVKGIL